MPGEQPTWRARDQKLQVVVCKDRKDDGEKSGDILSDDFADLELGLVGVRVPEGVHHDIGGATGAIIVLPQSTLISEIIEGEETVDVVAKNA